MTQFFKGLFQQAKKPESADALALPQDLAHYGSEYITYCIEQEQAIDRLESALHTSDNPQEIAMQTLKTACSFYGADWAGIIELDMDLGITTPGWWYHADPKVTRLSRMYE